VWEKLCLSLIWVKHSWRFIFAHKPLCESFSEDVIEIKGAHLCRSCCFLYLGLFAALLTLIIVNIDTLALEITYAMSLLICITLSCPQIYKKLPRNLRDVLRLTLGSLITLTFFLILTGQFILGGVGAAILLAFRKRYNHHRAKRKLNACNSCSEYGKDKVCSGFAQQIVHIKRYQEEATDWKLASGYIPKISN
jgi:hypothetical protein